MNILIQTGRKIRKLREAKGLTQESLEEKSGINSKYISAIECGQANLTILKLEQLANALGVELYELLLITNNDDSEKHIKDTINKLLNEANKEKLKAVINKEIENVTKDKLKDFLELLRLTAL